MSQWNEAFDKIIDELPVTECTLEALANRILERVEAKKAETQAKLLKEIDQLQNLYGSDFVKEVAENVHTRRQDARRNEQRQHLADALHNLMVMHGDNSVAIAAGHYDV